MLDNLESEMNALPKFTLDDGTVFEGVFERNLLVGKGIVIQPDGRVRKMNFDKGTFIGK